MSTSTSPPAEPPPRASVEQHCIVAPAAEDAKPWTGALVPLGDPSSPMASTLVPGDAGRWAVVRCVDPCQARGIAPGREYLVRADFVRLPDG